MRKYLAIWNWFQSPLLWLGYFGLIALKQWHGGWWLLAWFGGGLLAWFYQFADQLVAIYLLKPDNQLSLEVRQLVSSRDWLAAGRMLYVQREKQESLVSISIVFLAFWVVISVFLLTSSDSWLARGLVMGVGLRAVGEILSHWQRLPVLKQKMFWQVKRTMSDDEVRAIVAVYLGAFLSLSLLL